MRIRRKLFPQTKVEAAYCVKFWVIGPHYCKYPPHRAKVLIHTVIINVVYVGGDQPRAYPLREYMEERDWVLDYLEVYSDSQPGAEGLSFTSCDEVILYNGSIQYRINCLVCIIISS